MKSSILLTGGSGQLGGELLRFLPRLGDVVAPDRRQMDLTKPGDIRRVLRETRPGLIVNAAAYTNVDQAESDKDTSRAVNADAPALIAEEAKKTGAALVHYSTDYVFDGTQRTPYRESDRTNPVNVYGRTKLAGEQAVQSAGIPHLILRTSWLFGTRSQNFLTAVLKMATQQEELKMVADQTGGPTSSLKVAEATARILEGLGQPGGADPVWARASGIYHLTAGGAASRYEQVLAIIEEARQAPSSLSWFAAATGGRPIVARRVVPITTAEQPKPARRPAYSVLSNALLLETFGIELPDWRAQLHSAFTTENA